MHTSLKQFGIILKQEGTSRHERYVPELHETGKLLDDRKLQDFILYMQEYSKNLLFVNTDKGGTDHAESWEDFFGNDPVLLIANIASVDISKIKDEYDHLKTIFDNNETVESFSELVNFVFSRFVLVNKWYTLSPTDGLLQQDLYLYIRSYLQKEVENLREIMLYLSDHLGDDMDSNRKAVLHTRHEKSRKELEGMEAIWKLDQKENIPRREKIFSGGSEKEKLINASLVLDKIFKTVYHATDTIAERSGKYFDETILHKRDHNPHVALIIAFIKLFAYEQEEMNKVPERLLNFYYRNVLRIKEQGAIPDKTYIIFELAKGFDTCMVKKGTRLSAGKDKQNKELLYKTDKDIVLNKAQVSQLHTALVDRNKNGEILNYYVDTVKQAAEKTGVVPARQPGLFGEKNPLAITETGFAIASSQFYLAKAERNIVITFNGSYAIEPAEDAQNNNTELFDKSIFKLLLTGEKGWISSEDKAAGINIKYLRKNNNNFELSFSISIAQEQAIVPFDKKLHAGSFNTAFPLMQFILKYPAEIPPSTNGDGLIHQLNILQQLQISGAAISVQVGNINMQPKISFDGVKDLILENDDTVLDNKKPFYPFTPIPKVSSSFYIGCKDLFYKKIQNLSVNIEWLLPDNFRTYYQKYNPPYDSNKFIASLSYLDKKRWEKYADISLIDVNTSDVHFRIIKMNLDKKKPDAALPDEEISKFDSVKKNGTLKLTLHYPDFGHSIYPQLLTSTIMDKATTKSGNVDFYKLVKQRLHNDIFTIETPSGVNQKNGPLKVMYDIIDFTDDDAQAKSMLVTALSNIISKQNGIEVLAKKSTHPADSADEQGSHQIVHDQTLIEKVLRIFRHLDILKRDIHDDHEKQGVGDVVDEIDKDIVKVADFVLPSKKEMNNLITTEVNKIIIETVIIIVDRIMEQRAKDRNMDPNWIASVFDEEFVKAKKVINDVIAKKIATFLSTNEIPPPPYSPLINNISLNYSSSKKMSGKDNDKLFHLTPLGSIVETNIWMDDVVPDVQAPPGNSLPAGTPVTLNNATENPQPAAAVSNTSFLLPQTLLIKAADTAATPLQGMLFIGIRDLLPDQNLSLFFQFAEGTKNDDRKPPPVYWFYLKNNEWKTLEKDNLISDSTHNLQNSGIIEFSMPGDANNLNTLFNSAFQYWLCAGVTAGIDGFPQLTDVKAQAVGVTFIDFNSNPQHMALPLEAQKIKTIIDEVPPVKKVIQPVPSFNGKVGEKENEYYMRVSERLRHKARAINNWDYESLVLERFPSFFKIKCLNNYYNGHFAVGNVTVVPIADLRNRNYAGSNILLPKINYIELRNIEEFLCSKASPFVKIHAINPKLENILVRCKVKFKPGRDKGFCLVQLNGDLVNFLTPWATDADKISFSGKVYSSAIINFIDKREYVDYVQDLEMFQYPDSENEKNELPVNPDELEPLVETELTTQHSILVSAPRHYIELVE